MAALHHIYWWNVENLFDVEDAPARPDWLRRTLASELKGWTEAVLQRKIHNLCSVLKQLNQGRGPDILGLCEIENEAVVRRLMDRLEQEVGRNYNILHKDTSDQRGIDIAIVYDQDMYRSDGRMFSLEIMKRAATRDLFQIQLTTLKGNELVLIGNHWPSRLGGKYESEPYRMMVGETLCYWIERIHQIKKESQNIDHPSIIVMGDFNDDPYDRSLTEYLLSTPSRERVKNARNPVLLNLMHPFLHTDIGTHVHGNQIGFLDQFIVSRALAVANPKYPFRLVSTDIIHLPGMVRGAYNTPVRYHRPSHREYNPDGFSDHLPIELVIKERG